LKSETTHPVFSMFILAVFAGIVILDLITLKWPKAGQIGVVFWFLSYGVFIVFACKSLWFMIQGIWTRKQWFTLIMTLLLIGVVVSKTPDPERVFHESAQQINCILKHLSQDRDWGFHKNCFLVGYPSRQFLLPAVPSILLGRSPFALNLGGSLYCILGMLIFSGGMLTYLSKHLKQADLIGASLLACIPHFYYVNIIQFNYEQAIYPFNMTLIACGLILYIMSGNKSLELLGISGLMGLYLIHVYTIGLAVYGLWIMVMFYLVKDRRMSTAQKLLILLLLLGSIISMSISFSIRGDVRLTGKSPVDWTVLSKDLLLAGKLLFNPFKGSVVVNPWMTPLIPITLLLALSFFFGYELFFVGLWCIATLLMTVYAQGYTHYSVHFRLLRTTIVVPVIITMIMVIIRKIKWLNLKRFYLPLICFILIFFTGVKYHGRVLKPKPNGGRYCKFSVWVRDQLQEDYPKSSHFRLYFDQDVKRYFIPLNDHLHYILPRAHAVLKRDACFDLGNINEIVSIKRFLVVSKDIETSCYSEMDLRYIGTFKHPREPDRQFYQVMNPEP
jgi:hypothetical protein